MNKIENPFILTDYVSPLYFCDREEETKSLMSALKNGRNVTLRSPRRIGKTGLIKNVFYHIHTEDKDIACFYVDLMSTKCLGDFVRCFGEKVIGKLDTPLQKAENFVSKFFRGSRVYWSADTLNGEPKIGLEFEPSEERHTLQQIFDYIAQSDRMCYIALDEFQQIAEYAEDNVEALLRTHIQQCNNARFIFSGSKQHLLSDMFSSPKRPFYRSTEKMGLDILDKNRYYEFAKGFFLRKGISLDESVFDMIIGFTEGVTWYMQYLLNRLYEVCYENVTKEDVIAAMQYILALEQDDYQRIISGLTMNQLDLLRAIAKSGYVAEPTAKEFTRKYRLPATSSIFRALQYLVDNEIIYKSERGYIVYDRFFGQWLKEM